MDDILKGAYDMHIHTSPDVSPRKSTDLEIAEEWKTAGMKGGVVKCHFADTTGRAAILSALYPDLKIYGGLVLNRQAGGINPDDLVVGTGHIGGQEGVPVVLEAAKRGVKRLVLTHAENPATSFSIEDQKLCVKAGAMVEHSFFTVYHNRVSWELVIEQIRAVGTDNTCHRFRPAKFPGIRRWTPHVCGRSSGTWIFGERDRQIDQAQSGEIVPVREKSPARRS